MSWDMSNAVRKFVCWAIPMATKPVPPLVGMMYNDRPMDYYWDSSFQVVKENYCSRFARAVNTIQVISSSAGHVFKPQNSTEP